MAETIVMQLRPKFQELRDARTYSEPQVKNILFGFARDYEKKCSLPKMRAKKLRQLIDEVFNFD